MLNFMFGLIVGVCLAMVILSVSRQSGSPAPVNPLSGRTVVELRQTKGANAKRWTATVKYDSWGSPYVCNSSGYSAESLRPDGTTSDYWLYGTEWQRQSGPEVVFGKRPKNAFGEDKRDPNRKEQSDA